MYKYKYYIIKVFGYRYGIFRVNDYEIAELYKKKLIKLIIFIKYIVIFNKENIMKQELQF